MTGPDATHFLQIEGGGYGPVVICTAPVGARCHKVCDRPDCVESCACAEPSLVDTGECNQVEWLNNDDDIWEAGEGVALLPIDLKWEGDYYSWSFVKPVQR